MNITYEYDKGLISNSSNSLSKFAQIRSNKMADVQNEGIAHKPIENQRCIVTTLFNVNISPWLHQIDL